MSYQPRLKDKYQTEVIAKLQEKFQYSSIMQVPKLEKICVSQGIGLATSDKKLVDTAVEELTLITGQRAVKTKAKKSISNFKLREGMPIGARVTLRNERMFEFLDRLINVALPRVRDFRGISAKSFDGRGNYTLGIREHIIFTEIDISKVARNLGLNVSIVTTAKTDAEAFTLLDELGLPFRK